MKIKLLLLFTIIFFSSCKEEMTKDTVKSQFSLMGKIANTKTTISTISIWEDSAWYTAGDRKQLVKAQAEIISGIDVSKIEVEDVDNDKVVLILPDPKFISYKITDVNFLDKDIGFFRDDTEEAGQAAKIEKFAENKLLEKVDDISGDILSSTHKNSIKLIESFVKQLGFKTVIFKNKEVK